MSEQLQLRRGTAAQIAANTPAAGEVWVDTDHNRLVVGDGSTVGGFAVPKMTRGRELRGGRQGGQRQLGRRHAAPRSRCRPASPATASTRLTRDRDTGVVADRGAGARSTTPRAAAGVAICSPQALSGLTNGTPATAGNAIDLTLALAAATFFTATTLYFRITTAQGRRRRSTSSSTSSPTSEPPP